VLTQPSSMPDARVRDALLDNWGLRCEDITYLTLGAGSHHWRAVSADGAAWFVTVDDVRTKPWLGDDVTVAARRLDAALGVPLLLRERDGLDVVAPVLTVDGSPTHGLDAATAVSVTPWAEGEAGAFSMSWGVVGRDAVLDQLARMHVVAPPTGLHVATLLPERGSLREALGSVGDPWTGGPLSEAARSWLAASVDDVERLLDDLESLERSWSGRPLVITHGEPHPGNVLVSCDRRRLVDWDTAALAPPERDLWWFRDGDLSRWTARTGIAIDAALLAAYAVAWTLADVASFVSELRAPHDDTDDTRAALGWLMAQDVSPSALDAASEHRVPPG
jgi:spectinomycin phosphotransferase